MSEPHFTLPKVAIQFDGERFLCFTNRSLLKLKTDHKTDALDLFSKGETLEALPLLIWCGRLWAEPELTLESVREWFLDNGGPMSNNQWALDVAEALTGKRPELKSDPPVADGATS